MNLYHKNALIITCIQTFACMSMDQTVTKSEMIIKKSTIIKMRKELKKFADQAQQRSCTLMLLEKKIQFAKKQEEQKKQTPDQLPVYTKDERCGLFPVRIEKQAAQISMPEVINNKILLELYVEGMYDRRSPLKTRVKLQKMLPTVACLCHNVDLTSWANKFLQHNPNKPTTTSQRDQNAAIFLGSLCTYSDNQELLLQACRYLENAQLEFPMQNACIKENRGILFLNLATIQRDPMIANLYYKKSAELDNPDGIVAFATSWLKQAPTTENEPGLCGVHGQTILTWLTHIPTGYEDENINKQINVYLDKYNLDTDLPIMREARRNIDLLVNSAQCTELSAEQFANYMSQLYNNENEQTRLTAVEELESMACTNRPYESAILAQYFCSSNVNLSRKYVAQAVANGIIPINDEKYVFKNQIIKELMFQYLNHLLIHATTTTSCDAIKFLKTTVEQHKIDSDAFAALFKRQCGYDLTEYTEWTGTTQPNLIQHNS